MVQIGLDSWRKEKFYSCSFFWISIFFLFLLQQIANGILMAAAAVIGLMCYFLGEAKQRRAFLEAKKSLEVKMVIEEQSAEQVGNYFSQRPNKYHGQQLTSIMVL